MAARHDGLDAARALAMMAVVTAHVSIPFMQTPIGWVVQDSDRHVGVDLLVWVIRAFVMPLFYWLSGYFSRAIFEHTGVTGYLRHRFARIFVPFAVAIVPCSLAVDVLWDLGREAMNRPVVAANVPKLQGSELPLLQLGHLWYLYYLLWFSAIALLVVTAVRRVRIPMPRGIAMLAIPVTATIGVLGYLGAVHTDTPLGFVPSIPFALYMASFFGWGWLVHAQPLELERYKRFAWHALAIAPALLAIVVAALFATVEGAQLSPPWYAIVASGLFTVISVIAILGLCTRHVIRPHSIVRLASESSYWFYVSHFPLVIALQVWLANADMPGVLKAGVVTAITTVVCLATYELVVRRTPLRRLLG